MFHVDDVLQLNENEKIGLIARRHPITLVPGLLTSMALIVIPFFFIFPLFRFGMPGVGVFLISVLTGIVAALRSFLLWDSNVLIVTNRRIVDVDQKGVFSRFVTEAALDSVSDVAWKRHGVLETLLSIGSVSIKCSSLSRTLEIVRTSHPEKLHETINELRSASTSKIAERVSESGELLRKLKADLEKASPETIEKVERALRGADSEPPKTTSLVVQKKEIE